MDHFECQHVYREVNGTADLLSKWSHKLDILQHFYTPQQLIGSIRGSYILDKLGTQNFRRRKTRRRRKRRERKTETERRNNRKGSQ